MALYLLPVFHIFEKRSKNLKIPVFIISFVDNGLFISQDKSFHTSNSKLFCSYQIMLLLLEQFELIIEHGKTEVFHYFRTQKVFNLSHLDLTILGGPILHSKEMWHYLGFIFNRKLNFYQHIDFYKNKAISTVKSMKMLGNLSRGLISSQKHLLYRMCILPIMLYEFPLWFYNKAFLAYLLKILRNMQWRAALWILGAFLTSPSLGIEAIAGLIPIYLHLQKLSGRLQLRTQLLLLNHIINSLLESRHSFNNNHYHLLLENLTSKQWLKVKGPIINTNNRFNGIFYSFYSFSNKFSPRNRLIDVFPSCFSFYLSNRKYTKVKKAHLHKLDELIFHVSVDPKTTIVVSDASIKNQVTTSIAHIYIHDTPVVKMIHHAVNITFTEAKLFVIRCGLN